LSKPFKAIIAGMASVDATRRLLNRYYLTRDARQREAIWSGYAKLFRRRHPPVQAGAWLVEFAGKSLRIPLCGESMWLDWDTALSIVAHDLEVKQIYELALAGADRPELFLDIGANYGTHSLLMAAHGVPTIAFEPLPECVAYARRLAGENEVDVRFVNAALGEQPGTLEFAYPARDTWLATALVSDDDPELVRTSAPVFTLDDFADETKGKRLLIKIDVEGLEAAVLAGGGRVLDQQPTIVFESNPGADRRATWNALAAKAYAVAALELNRRIPLQMDDFDESKASNFVAWPADQRPAWLV
jgi:FkbM family methyltransferase